MSKENGKVDFYDLQASALVYVDTVLRDTDGEVTPQEAFAYMAVRGPLHTLN